MKEYYGHTVTIIDKNGKSWTGYVDEYILPEDNESGKEAIVVDFPSERNRYVQFEKKDIKSIKIVDSLQRKKVIKK